MKQAIIILFIILGCNPKLHAQSDSLRIIQHLKTITKTDGFGYDALMVTNTAFYRNYNYHKTSDTMETLDIPKMMKVIDATTLAIN